jgi:hypothetical protein
MCACIYVTIGDVKVLIAYTNILKQSDQQTNLPATDQQPDSYFE